MTDKEIIDKWLGIYKIDHFEYNTYREIELSAIHLGIEKYIKWYYLMNEYYTLLRLEDYNQIMELATICGKKALLELIK
jgi:hypothetical protein